MTQGETVRILAEIAKQKFTSVPGRKEKSTTYQTRKTYGNSIKAGKPTTEGCGGRGKGVRFKETRQMFKVYILGGSDKLDIFEGRYYLRGV